MKGCCFIDILLWPFSCCRQQFRPLTHHGPRRAMWTQIYLILRGEGGGSAAGVQGWAQLVTDELRCLLLPLSNPCPPAVLAPALPPPSRGFILVRMCKPSSGFGHSEPGDLHNGITAYSSITVHEYAKLLMLVTVICLPWQVPSWGSFWAIYWQWGFSSWVSYFQLWVKRKTPQSATWNRGEQNSENGKNIF